MPAPGDARPARFELHMRDYNWPGVYAPIAAAVEAISRRLNPLQFLSIRQYLSVVFGALLLFAGGS